MVEKAENTGTTVNISPEALNRFNEIKADGVFGGGLEAFVDEAMFFRYEAYKKKHKQWQEELQSTPGRSR